MNLIRDYSDLYNPDQIFVSFDVETTGLNAQTDRIVELGAVKYGYEQVLGVFHTLINPESGIPVQVTAIHGISDEMVAGKPVFSEIKTRFEDFIQDCILVAHNAPFDVEFINNALARSGGHHMKNSIVDTLDMSRKAFPGQENYKQVTLAEFLDIPVHNAHRANDDARVCMDLFLKCRDKMNPGNQMNLL